VIEGLDGHLVPPGDSGAVADAIADILTQPDRAAAMGRSSLAISRRHTHTATFDAHESLYMRVIEDFGREKGSADRHRKRQTRHVPFRRAPGNGT
jgi:glycosyltransferase involved in cell wall biosynthesis